ncbi:dihydroorotate dehydrogenase B catalytic subunit [Candidatus Desantisbacteria bacterium CG1_02_38_46]|uniref:Dihydroorotate dehydrogenase n=2 Tax=unclassified Candidatus Desantisiibacteriota TaxID=3106372 RepID=A0A1J4SCZ3_9BACT|nr:MAG: dihydroorotate dehydrogenase B catalytic subunit [Candidatus Desantisbacteria bacterium CG1_02_38_46]PIU51265.1 MAG: dihydroorotate dehydrogenase [Candidatus Desantisbacteria bacterium CG07_land_8_20_14_0_80_39_15]
MNTNLEVNIAGIKMKNPVMCASGTFNFGEEYGKFFDLKKLGALVTKTITLKSREGNLPPRIYETPSGMLNSIGLQNPGVEMFLKEKMPFLRKIGIPVIVSVAGETLDEWTALVRELKGVRGISAIELNISCPNMKMRSGRARSTMFSQDADATFEVVRKVRKTTNFPLIVKLSPNVTDITVIAKAAQKGGADAISLINTVLGMAVNLEKRAPVLDAITGGLSGPAIKPIALRMVWEVSNAVKIPLIGMGGIMTARDALEFMLAGASAVAVGTANFINPRVIPQIIEEIKKYLVKNKISNINSLKIGTAPIL